MAPLGLAPTSRATTSPSLNSNSVGILMTENLVAVATLRSTSSLPIVNLSDCSTANSSRIGAIILHGPHHSAQKSTRIGLSDAPTTSSNVASVRVVICSLISTSIGGAVVRQVTTLPGGLALVTLRLEPSFGVDGRDAPGPGRRDGLAIDVVLYVAGREQTVDVRVRTKPRAHVSVLLEIGLAHHQRRVRDVSDGDEDAGDVDHPGLAAQRVLHRESRDLVLAEHLGDFGVP